MKEFPVTIINDQKLEDNETVLLKLDEPFLLRRWAMTTNAFDAMMLDLISNSDEEVDPYWVQNQAIASGGGDGGEDGGGGGGDTDGDGLSDDEETNLGTDPNSADSDGDTFSDGDEVAQGTDPLNGADFPEDGGGDGGDGGEEEEEVPLPEPIATALLGKDYLHVLTILDDDLGVVSLTSPSKKTNEDGMIEGAMVFEIEVPAGTPKWKFKGDPGMITSPAIGPNGLIYLGSGSGSVYAVHPDGSLQWSFKADGSIAAAPAIASDGTVYFATSAAKLYSLDAFGTLNWITDLGAGVQGSSPAIGADGTVYVGSLDQKVYAVDPDGVIKWTSETGGWVTTSPAINVEGTIMITGNDAKLHAINALGQALWTFALPGEGVLTAPAVNDKEAVYFGATWQATPEPQPEPGPGGDGNPEPEGPPPGPSHQLIAVEDGKQKWAFDAGGMIFGQPIVDGFGNIFFGAGDGKIYAVNSKGIAKWEYDLRIPPSTSVMFLEKGVLCVGAAGKLFLISSSGELLNDIEVSQTPLAEAIVGPDGTLYVPSLDGVLHAYKGDDGGLPDKGFARFGGNYQNTGRYGAGIKPGGAVVPTGPVRDVVVNLNVTGSASSITDFEDLGGNVVIPAGTNRLEVMFVPLDDPQLEFDENIEVKILSVEGGSFIKADAESGISGKDKVEFVLSDNDSQLEFANVFFDVRENFLGTNAVVTVQRTGPPNSIKRVDYATADGTAIEGEDYESVSGTLIFLPGELEKSFEIPIIDNPWVEEQETVLLNLSNVTGGWPVSGQSTATLRIKDDDSAFEFSASEFAVTENGQVALIQVSRIGALDYSGAVSVATADYGIFDPDTDAKVLAKLPEILKEMFPDDLREWALVSTTHHGEYTRATISSELADENTAKMRFILFNSSLDQGEEGGEEGEEGGEEGEEGGEEGDPEEPVGEPYDPTVVAVYNLVGEVWELIYLNENISNEWVALYDTTPAEGEAEAGIDYESTGITVQFPIDASEATVLIPIVDDIETETTETFTMILSNPVSGYIADQATAAVGIIDDECSIEMTITSVEAPENGGPLSIEVRRSGGLVNPVTIVYEVRDGTAENTIDYLKGAGRIKFDVGQEVAYIVLPIINDIEMEGLETFELLLVNALVDPEVALEGSATLGEITEIKITIIDDEMPGGVDLGFKLIGGVNGPVNKLYVGEDERILLGGAFSRVGGVLYNNISRLHRDGYVDSSFNIGAGIDNTVWSLSAQKDQKPIVGGDFKLIDTNPAFSIGRLNADGVYDQTFEIGSGVNGEVYVVVNQSDGKVLLGGSFDKFNEIAVGNIVRLNDNGSFDETFNIGVGADGVVKDIFLQGDGKILIAGDFKSVSGIGRNRIARLTENGEVDENFAVGLGANAIIHSIDVQYNGSILLGGEFTKYEDQDAQYLVRLSAEGQIDKDWLTSASLINNFIYDIAVLNDDKILIGGAFTAINSYSRNSFARLQQDGELDRNFDPGEGADGPVFTMAVQVDGNILIGGEFSNVGGIEQKNISRVYGGDQFTYGRIDFQYSKIEYREDDISLEVIVKRSGKVEEPVTLQFEANSGSATVGEDFQQLSGEINFDKNAREAIIKFNLIDDEIAEGAESFTINLFSDDPGLDLSGRSSIEVVIIDNESSASFLQTELTINESVGEALLLVNRYGSLTSESTIDYTINSVTAKSGEDYISPATGTLVFSNGASSAFVALNIIDDLLEEPAESLKVNLSNPSSGLTLVGELTASVIIVDNDQPVLGLTTFEKGQIPADSGWISSGNNPWYAQTDSVYGGNYALRSGKINDLQETVLMLDRETGAGTGHFYLKVSTEQDWDALEFLLNGRVLGKWSGRVNWKKFEFQLEAGNNRLEWRYRKDASTFAGMDAVFIDNVFIPEVPVVEPPPATKPTLVVAGVTAEGLQLTVTGDAATEYDVQFSTDLNAWSSLAKVTTDETGKAVFTDAASAEKLAQGTWVEATGFYRAVLVADDRGE